MRVKSERGRGGLVANVTYRDIHLSVRAWLRTLYGGAREGRAPRTSVPAPPQNVGGEAVQLTMNYAPHIPPTNATATPRFDNITLDGVTSASSDQGWFLDGLPESPIRGLTLRNVSVQGVDKQQVVGCDNVDAATSSCDARSVLPACPPCVPKA